MSTHRNTLFLSKIVLRGYNIVTFAAATELGRSTVSRMVNGIARPQGVTLKIVCDALAATPEELGLAKYNPHNRDFTALRNRASKREGQTPQQDG
jgi:hypothetical protein